MSKLKKITLAIFVLLISQLSFAGDITIHVKGMVCGFCAQGIEKKFKALSEVKSIHVSLSEKQVHISTQEGKDIGDEKIKDLITNAGYNIEKIERAK